jgi:hypothetical protein
MKRAMALPWLGLCLVILVGCGGNDNRTSNNRTSNPSATSVLTFTGVLDFARSSISLGNYTFKGGCADGDSGALTGVRFKPVTGIYSGTLGDTAVSADLTQSNLGQEDNWQLGGAVSAFPQLGGELALTNSTISGSMRLIDGSYDSGSCFTPTQLFSLSGTIDPQGNISGTASPGSVQETEPGYLHVSGTVTYTGPACSEVFTIKESWLAGSYIQLSLTAKDGTSTDVHGRVADSTASQLDLADVEGGCGSGGYGTLIQQ